MKKTFSVCEIIHHYFLVSIRYFLRYVKNINGFTMVELALVITIIGVLTAIAIPSFFTAIRQTIFQNKLGEIVQLIELARTQALASEINKDKRIPPGGFGLYFDKNAAKAFLFIDDWNANDSKKVKMDYASVIGRVIPDEIFTAPQQDDQSDGDTLIRVVDLGAPKYFEFSTLIGDSNAINDATIIFTPPYADAILHNDDNNFQEIVAEFQLKTDDIKRSIKINRITTTPQVK